uniref:Restriction endonuclease subunit R n=1 Tax=candidate division WOR-3 bacterium TaxID=2052148 RepID=A0A7C6A9E6_UNCW3
MRLEKYLALNKYLLSRFGANRVTDLRDKLKEQKEGFDSNGRSYFSDVLIGLENLKIPPDVILHYDRAIREYSERLSKNRRDALSLKYFQYLAILFTEIYLDRYFNRHKELLRELNSFIDILNEEISRPEDKFSYFMDNDLKKLAFWMATGSGKTLIMHINYWQYLKYKKEKLDNIILVTPNEGMSGQHYREMQRSGIPCRLYTENTGSLTLYPNEVLVIDIHKLTEEKKGAGVRVEVDYFAGKNLVFIDEGHKGAGTEEKTWKKLRERLAETGFIFEYSATFGQVIGPQDKELLDEYSKAIIFDYSYKYFYTDGYGKDFYVYNLREKSFQEKFRDLILTGNLLSFYEQILLYESHQDELKEYKIEKPLWAFIGSKVSGAGINSDVLKVVKFLKKAIADKNWLKESIEKILNGKSGLTDPQGHDIFKKRFEYIRENGYKIENIYERLFNAKTGTLTLCELKSAEGEIGLKVGEGDYFGVINIGDVSGFKKLLEKSGIEVKADSITPSLFERVNEYNSNINIIIGAKKFIEGWDSWRVCSMGLINMGKGEGPQIIQLFGRGVRLKGRNSSLKRSVEKKYPVKTLETLNIFGLNADYVNAFLNAIQKEEVEYEEIQLPIKFVDKKKWERKLYILQPPADFDFTKQLIKLEMLQNILEQVKIDIRPRVRLAHGLEVTEAEVQEEPISLNKQYLDLLDWDEIFLEIIDYKIAQGYFNLSIDNTALKEIIQSNGFELYAFPEQIAVNNFADLSKFRAIVILILQNYIDRFYNSKKRKALSKVLKPAYLTQKNENLSLFKDGYSLKIEKDKDKKEIIKKIRQLVKKADELYKKDLEEIPTIHFDRHLYTPLVVYGKGKEYIESSPPKLNEGETEFINMLRKYLKDKQSEFKDQEIFLLRNLSRRGIEFYETQGYFPDFIIWRKKGNKQSIGFIDPKGIRNVEDEKIQLHKTIKELEESIGEKNLQLESVILSVSKYKEIRRQYGKRKSKEEFEQEHVLFLKDDKEKAIEKLFQIVS